MKLALVAYLVPDYDVAIAWCRDGLGWDLLEDTDMGGGKRWVRMAAPGGGSEFLIAKAATPEQARGIGRHAGGRVGYFLHVEDFDAAAARLTAVGTAFDESPRDEPYGRVAVFQDPFGNRWDMIEPRP